LSSFMVLQFLLSAPSVALLPLLRMQGIVDGENEEENIGTIGKGGTNGSVATGTMCTKAGEGTK